MNDMTTDDDCVIGYDHFDETWHLDETERAQLRQHPLPYLIETDLALFGAFVFDETIAQELRTARDVYGGRTLLACIFDGAGIDALRRYNEELGALRYVARCEHAVDIARVI